MEEIRHVLYCDDIVYEVYEDYGVARDQFDISCRDEEIYVFLLKSYKTLLDENGDVIDEVEVDSIK